jgi:hypothetical protein
MAVLAAFAIVAQRLRRSTLCMCPPVKNQNAMRTVELLVMHMKPIKALS